MSTPRQPGGNPFDDNGHYGNSGGPGNFDYQRPDPSAGPPDHNRDYGQDPYGMQAGSGYPDYGQSYGGDPFGAPGYGGDQPGYPTNNYGGPNYGTPMANQTLAGFGAPNAAGPWRRLVAYLIDSIVVGLIGGLLAVTFFDLPVLPQSEADMPQYLNDLSSFSVNVSILGAILFFLYATVLQTTGFQTLGKRALGIRATDANGGKLPVAKSALRNVWLLLPAIPFLGWLGNIVGILIFIFAFQGDKTQGLNDKWAKTRVLTR